MQEAINLVMQRGGYDPKVEPFWQLAFWQALGRALGWKKYIWTSYPGYCELWLQIQTDAEEASSPFDHEVQYATRDVTAVWFWHRYLDAVAEEKNLDEFFTKIIQESKNVETH